MSAFVIALLGAESTGKSTLAATLAARLSSQSSLSVACVGEWLREWCEHEGRTPRADEQAQIARLQHQRIDAAAARHDVVICDTTALTTAAYSRILFADPSLDAMAASLHRRADLTLLTALDLPWVPDGLQRDGAHLREPVDAALRALMTEHGIAWSVVAGLNEQRVEAAFDAVTRTMKRAQQRRVGLFSALADIEPGGREHHDWLCRCERCDVPEYERVSRREARR